MFDRTKGIRRGRKAIDRLVRVCDSLGVKHGISPQDSRDLHQQEFEALKSEVSQLSVTNVISNATRIARLAQR